MLNINRWNCFLGWRVSEYGSDRNDTTGNEETRKEMVLWYLQDVRFSSYLSSSRKVGNIFLVEVFLNQGIPSIYYFEPNQEKNHWRCVLYEDLKSANATIFKVNFALMKLFNQKSSLEKGTQTNIGFLCFLLVFWGELFIFK